MSWISLAALARLIKVLCYIDNEDLDCSICGRGFHTFDRLDDHMDVPSVESMLDGADQRTRTAKVS
jgi:hypothetical protein